MVGKTSTKSRHALCSSTNPAVSKSNAKKPDIRDEIEKLAERGHAPIALCSPRTRLHVRRLVEHTFSMLVVLSYAEIAPDINVDSIGMVTLNNAN